MIGPPSIFWGKLEQREGEVLAWHPLEAHAADVAAVCRRLLDVSLISRRLAALGGVEALSPVQRDRLATLAALHDLGKYNLGFQNKALGVPPLAGHVGPIFGLLAGAPALGDDFATSLADALSIETLYGWTEAPEGAYRLLAASLAHHGRPLSLESGVADPALWRPARGLDPLAGMAGLVSEVRRWFPGAFAPGAALPSSPAFQHAFSGLVTLSDWIGSHRHFFPFQNGPGERFGEAWERSAAVLGAIGLDVAAARRRLGSAPVGFERIAGAGLAPRPMQQVVLELPVPQAPSTVVLEAETGSGKTEAALLRFAHLLQAGVVDGMYFALPTRTAATQIHRRLVDAVARLFPNEAERPPVVLAVPGYLRVDDAEGRRLPDFEVLWNDDAPERWRYRGWAAESAKRYLAGAVVVGTIDQVLLSALAVPHAHLRATSLLRQLLVVDEVHASDAYMNRLLQEVLARHRRAGGHALLMSATLGAHARAALIGLPRRERPGRTESERAEYPLVSQALGTGGQVDVSLHAPKAAGSSKPVSFQLVPQMDDAEAVAKRALAAARAGAKVLVIRNTVAGCLATQQALEARAEPELMMAVAGVPAPHHSRYARVDREALDKEIEARLGKAAPDAPVVVVATQTVQQSLDLDADLLITDLCPMDVLLQRVGRLHRHVCARPAGFETARAEVLVPGERDLTGRIRPSGEAGGRHGLGSVYRDLRIIEATWRVLETLPDVEIPRDNRRLVEGALHPDVLGALERSAEPWSRHGRKVEGQGLAEALLARGNGLRWDVGFGDAAACFPSRELDADIRTRLGEDDRRVVFEAPLPGPFGQGVHELTVPAHQAREVPADALPEHIALTEGAARFTFGPHRFVYDRLGLRQERTETP